MRVQENILPSIELLVLKRDGRKVSFEQDKIFSALRRANQELEHPVSEASVPLLPRSEI
ncbi:MAG TPA: ATP cone domain-containing protein, partial [Streptococcus parasuis]|nr:ATP cone domain-containing protein [Streptococcus parasuis]